MLESVSKQFLAWQVAAVLNYACENGVEPFLEPALDLAAALIEQDSRLAASGVPDAGPHVCFAGCTPAAG